MFTRWEGLRSQCNAMALYFSNEPGLVKDLGLGPPEGFINICAQYKLIDVQYARIHKRFYPFLTLFVITQILPGCVEDRSRS